MMEGQQTYLYEKNFYTPKIKKCTERNGAFLLLQEAVFRGIATP